MCVVVDHDTLNDQDPTGDSMKVKKVRKRNKDYTARVNRRHRVCVCEWCGIQFLAARYGTLTCSDNHRLRLSRWMRAMEKKFGYRPGTGPRGDEDRMNPRHQTQPY